jgi:hypothetical protein
VSRFRFRPVLSIRASPPSRKLSFKTVTRTLYGADLAVDYSTSA